MSYKRLIALLLTLSVAWYASGQSAEGITYIADTSYSNWTAYQKELKDYPYISLVEKKRHANVIEKNNVIYNKIKGRSLKLDVFSPRKRSDNNHTAIIMLHGGGWRSGNRYQHHPLAQYLAALGYTVFTPEYRLSTEALYPAAIYDVKCAIKWLRTNAAKYKIDPARIAIAGFSAGGLLATLAGNTSGITLFEGHDCNYKATARADAIINIDGILSFIHPESGEGDDSKRKSAATLWFGYAKNENPGLWQQASPLIYAGKSTVPILFINSSVDRMHAGRDEYLKIMDEHKIYNEVHTFENSPHSFVLFNPWLAPTVHYIDIFLKRVFNKEVGK